MGLGVSIIPHMRDAESMRKMRMPCSSMLVHVGESNNSYKCNPHPPLDSHHDACSSVDASMNTRARAADRSSHVLGLPTRLSVTKCNLSVACSLRVSRCKLIEALTRKGRLKKEYTPSKIRKNCSPPSLDAQSSDCNLPSASLAFSAPHREQQPACELYNRTSKGLSSRSVSCCSLKSPHRTTVSSAPFRSSDGPIMQFIGLPSPRYIVACSISGSSPLILLSELRLIRLSKKCLCRSVRSSLAT